MAKLKLRQTYEVAEGVRRLLKIGLWGKENREEAEKLLLTEGFNDILHNAFVKYEVDYRTRYTRGDLSIMQPVPFRKLVEMFLRQVESSGC